MCVTVSIKEETAFDLKEESGPHRKKMTSRDG